MSKKERRITEPPKDKAPLSEGNLVEQIDTILYDIGSSLPEGNSDRNEIIIGSLELREWARRKRYVFNRKRLTEKLKTNRRLPLIFEHEVKNMEEPEDECRILNGVSDQVTEQFLQRVGILKPEESFAALMGSDRWGRNSVPGPLLLWTGTRAWKPSLKDPSVSMYQRYLDTTTPGLNVAVVKEEFTGKYEIFCRFNSHAVGDILKGPSGNSLFAQELNK